MTEVTPENDDAKATASDPDADPENLNPRDTTEEEPYEGDPDADPGNLNPRSTQ